MSVEVSRVLDRSDGVSLQAKVQATVLIIPERGAWRQVLQQSEIRFNMTINFFWLQQINRKICLKGNVEMGKNISDPLTVIKGEIYKKFSTRRDHSQN